MDSEIFVKNINFYCKQRDEPPTVACAKAGVGHGFVTDVKRGRTPTISKVQRLAEYLGVTTSDLLGEEKPAGYDTSGSNAEQIEVIELYKRASPEMRAAMLQALRAAEAARPSQGGAKGAG